MAVLTCNHAHRVRARVLSCLMGEQARGWQCAGHMAPAGSGPKGSGEVGREAHLAL